MRKLLFLALLPALAWGQVLRLDRGTGTFASAPTFPGAVSTGTVQTKGLVSTALTTPTNATFTAGAGTLTTATYYYRVAACNAAGCTDPSTETSLAVTGPAGVNVNWGSITGSTSYKVYCRTTGAEQLCATVTAPTVTWLDAGSVTPSGAIPSLSSSAAISTVSGLTARDITTTAASGATAIVLVSGSKICLNGTLCSVYLGVSGLSAGESSINSLRYVTAITASTVNPPVVMKGGAADGATAVAWAITNANTLSTAGSRIVTFAPDNAGTVKAAIDKDGSYQQTTAPTLQTCAIGTLFTETVQAGGSAGKYSKKCLCVSDTQASPTYAWKNTSGVFALEATSVGNATTCPDP